MNPSGRLSELTDVTSDLRQGKVDSLPDRFIVDLNRMSKDDFLGLLEIARDRSFGPELTSAESRQKKLLDKTYQLELVRGLLQNGSYAEADKLLGQEAEDEDPETAIARARSMVFTGRYAEALGLLMSILSTPGTLVVSRGVCSQLIGHCLMELGERASAKMYLEMSLDIANAVGNRPGRIATHLFLAKLAAFEGSVVNADRFLSLAFSDLITAETGPRWMIGFYRTASHVYALRGEATSLAFAMVALRLSEALGDTYHSQKGVVEMAIISKGLLGEDHKVSRELLSRVESLAGYPESDLDIWIAAGLGEEHPAGPHTLEVLLEVTSDQPQDFSLSSWEKKTWVHDRRFEIFICLLTAKATKLESDSPLAKILLMLSETSSNPTQEKLFETVWGLRFNAERHRGLLKTNVSRVNALGTPNKLVIWGDVLSLARTGSTL